MTPPWKTLVLAATCWTASGCGAASPVFRDAPPVWKVDDAQNIEEPSEREYDPKEYFAKVFVIERLDRTLELRDREPAGNVNSLEEVPDSTWFQNRLGVRRVTPAEAARGFEQGGPPQPPFVVTGGKYAGGNPGFAMKDATGRKFLVKFDTKQNPELQTTAGVVVNRIFWTAGYNVPSDHVFDLHLSQLTIGAEAIYTDKKKDAEPFDAQRLVAVLSTAPQQADGSYRAIASQLLDGKPKGGFSPKGTRKDDPNDRVRHEHRRELRGLRVLSAWVGHTDMREDNTLDVYVEDGKRRYLRHYLLDFGEALDGHAAETGRREDGWEHFIDWEMQTKALFAFGLWKRPWEDVRPTPWPALGSFRAEPFDPTAWREAYPYWPFAEMDASDAYWAAKIVMRFERPLLEAIVAEGKLSDPLAARFLVSTLIQRRNTVGRTYLDAVTPLDDFELTADRLCMTDLMLRYGLAKRGSVEWLDDGEVRATRSVGADGRLCVKLRRNEGYTVFRMRSRRGDSTRPPMELHFKAGARPRILGIVRVAR